ncbi:uncharacterized protein LOC129580638 [Paramacrobiotus metropolitanus]|uniref:uncharacterized protein LOC129580638 n=1 Tax=Paramacrobiotus metropolitanus TaxID=2943436 RepID=UPI0024462929|nr:uncharacterized protein LOC129580638 [Paramacrobiotus metropolitanus]
MANAAGKAGRQLEGESDTSAKKRRYGSILVAATPDITASSTDGSDEGEVLFSSEREWRSFATEYNCLVRLANVALHAKSKDEPIIVHLKENQEDNEWMIVIENTKEFPIGLKISAFSVHDFKYVEKPLLIITPTAEFFQRILDSARAIAGRIGNNGDASARCILISFDKRSSSNFFVRFKRRVKEGRIHAEKLPEEDEKKYLEQAGGADVRLAASLSQSKGAQSSIGMSNSEQLAPSCPNPFHILVDLLGVAAFLGKDAMFCFVPSKRVLKICPSRYARPKSCMTVDVGKFEYYQYDHSTGALRIAFNDISAAADIAQELIKLSDAKNLMEPGSNKLLCGSALRAILNESVNPVWLHEVLAGIGIPRDELPKDSLAKSLFPHIKGIGLPRAHHVNGTSVKGPLDNIVPLDNFLPPEKSHLNPISVLTGQNKPKTSWPAMVSAPKDFRQSNGLLPPSNKGSRMFEASQHQTLRKDTSTDARNHRSLSRRIIPSVVSAADYVRSSSEEEGRNSLQSVGNNVAVGLMKPGEFSSAPIMVMTQSSDSTQRCPVPLDISLDTLGVAGFLGKSAMISV